ncbi:armadillo-type protein [Polychytrium aggregatum]|uniref:armadillo-type protein n=1 Tax=Polychytrium aggregatum TaxID=110093 RepID=UPI0022FE2924|nr:armadillo-type protein [Polychytrium aggregatum]KAI9204779.1 armadillo-type protein [Polychytrium aggregatum]
MEALSQTVAQAQDIITRLYTHNVDPAFVQSAQQWLENLQKDPMGWDVALALLQSPSAQCQYFGALTLQVKFSHDWKSIPEDSIERFRLRVIEAIIQLSPGPKFVTTKLCLALTAYAFNAFPSHWDSFIRSFDQEINSAIEQCPVEEGKVALELSLLEFLTVLPEEMQNAHMIPTRKSVFENELSSSTGVVLATLQRILSLPIAEGISQPILMLKQSALGCLRNWISHIIFAQSATSVNVILDLVIPHLSFPGTFERSADALVELISFRTMAAYEKTICNFMMGILTKGWLRNELERAIRETDEHTAKVICNILVELGLNFTPYFVKNFLRDDVQVFYEMILACTNFEGYYAGDQELSALTLEFWAIFCETLLDPRIIQRPGVEEDGLEDLITDPVTGEPVLSATNLHPSDADRVFAKHTPVRSPAGATESESMRIFEAAKVLLVRAVVAWMSKITFPEDETWNEWNSDTKNKFKVFRKDCGENFLHAFYILREDLYGVFVPLAEQQILDLMEGRQSKWQPLEATLYAIRAVSEAADVNESVYLPRVFGKGVLEALLLVPAGQLSRVKYTMSLLIGAHSDWLSSHPDAILNSVNFLLMGLSQPDIAPGVAEALKSTCNSCKFGMVEGIDSLITIYGQIGPSLQMRERTKVLEAISSVIQAMPQQQSVIYLMNMLMNIVGDIKAILSMAAQLMPEQLHEQVGTQIRYMQSCCRGVQPIYVVEGDEVTQNMFSAEQLEQQRQISALVWEVTLELFQLFGDVEPIVNALCTFIEQTLRAALPLFASDPLRLVDVLTALFDQHSHACILQCGTTLISHLDEEWSTPQVLMDTTQPLSKLLLSFTNSIVRIVNNAEVMMDRSDVVAKYFALLTENLRRYGRVMLNFPPDHLNHIFMGMVVQGLSLSDAFVLHVLARFLVEFIGSSVDEGLAGLVSAVVGQIGESLIREIVTCVGGRSPPSTFDEFSRILFKMVSKYPEPTRQWLLQCLSPDGFPTAKITKREKEQFAKQVLGTRDLDRFKRAVKDFGLKSRGYENTAFGRSI